MKKAGDLARERVNQIIIENETLKAGFAALPYLVMDDLRLSLGARMTYAYLLKFAWQEGSTFVSQATLAKHMGLGKRQLQRYLRELLETGYLAIERKDKRFTNTYILKDIRSKLKARTWSRAAGPHSHSIPFSHKCPIFMLNSKMLPASWRITSATCRMSNLLLREAS